VSIHDPKLFYNEQPVTLMLLKELGGVCGAVSKFASSVCQAHGYPAFPVGQPGHCAHFWLKPEAKGGNRKWQIGNNCGSYKDSRRHGGIYFIWDDLTKMGWTVPIYEKAINNCDDFIASEILRLEYLKTQNSENLLDSIQSCVWNLRSWVTLVDSNIPLPSIDSDQVINLSSLMSGANCKINCDANCEDNLKSDCCVRKGNLFDNSGSEWWCPADSVVMTLDMPDQAEICEIKIQWWGKSRSKIFEIKIDDDVIVEYSEPENHHFDYNSWQIFQGNIYDS